MNLKGKRILIVDQHMVLGYNLMFEMKKLGLDTERLFHTYASEYQYTNIIHKFINLFQRNILNNKGYYQKLIDNHFDKYCYDSLKQLKDKQFDYIIVLRCDKFSEKFLQSLRNISDKMVAYQWDAIIVEKILTRQKYFDKICVYDPFDIDKHAGITLLHNYHFNKPANTNHKTKYDLLYLGSDFKNEFREQKLLKLLETKLFSSPNLILRSDIDSLSLNHL